MGRIIPARAGFTRDRPLPTEQSQDHPRSRGVYRTEIIARPSTLWIIPARAGFTQAGPEARPGARDHPRSRGVYALRTRGGGRPRGSSPLARGLHAPRRGADQRLRIIPARAGFTRSPNLITINYGDHPRSRGVYSTNFSSE